MKRLTGLDFIGREISAAVAQLVERVLGKDEVMGSSPISSFELLFLLVASALRGRVVY